MSHADLDTTDEAPILRGLQRGESGAYRVLIDAYGDRLYRFFLAMRRDSDLAEDQAAETIAALVDAFMRRKVEPANLGAYVFGVARNVSRRQWRRPPRKLVPLEEVPEIEDPDPTPAERDTTRRALERAARLLEGLPEGAREATYLRFVEQMSLAEVAEALHLPVGTVKSHIHRARRRLSEELHAEPRSVSREEPR